MTIGPVAEAAFVPTDIDQDIDVPLSMMLCMLPVFSVGHVPFAVGSIGGIWPLPPVVAPLEDPLEEPLDEPLEDPLDPLLPPLPLDCEEPLEPPDPPPELEPAP